MFTKVRRFEFFDQLEIFEADGYHADFPLHIHDTICITLVTNGTECTQVHQHELVTPFEGISITYPDEIHANPNRNDGSYSFLTYYLSHDVLSYFNGKKEVYFNDRILQDEQLYRLLLSFGVSANPSEEEFASILNYLSNHHCTDRANHTVGENLASVKFTEVLDFIDHNFAKKLTIEKLAKMKNLSSFSFIRHFKKAKGITPAQYITLKRIEAAKKLLRNGNPIVDAVYNAGFYDQSHMSRNFKKITGTTPRSYQRACNIVQE